MIPENWLDEKVDLEEADRRAGAGRNEEWTALKAQMEPGDEVWTFASPAESWRNLAGRAGLALVRGGVPIQAVVTLMN